MGFQHHTTPKKAKLKGAYSFLTAKGIPHYKTDLFKHFKVSRATGYRFLNEDDEYGDRTFHSSFKETRGRKKLFDSEALATIEKFLESNGFDGRTVSYAALPAAAGLDIDASPRTIRRAIGSLDFRFCVACHKQWNSARSKERRVEYSRVMLEKYPEKQDWWHCRFSDECHFGYQDGKYYVLRRPWEKYCSDCVVEKREPPEKDLKRVHCWAAVGHDFKSPLVWYDSGNSNGKMTLKCYRDQILEPVVGEWLRNGETFVLEEDGDSGHGTGKNNIVRTWKEQNDLQHYFNCAESPDFVPIEKAWQSPKAECRKQALWDDEGLVQSAEAGWEKLRQPSINKWVDEIPSILKQCIELDGAMTAH